MVESTETRSYRIGSLHIVKNTLKIIRSKALEKKKINHLVELSKEGKGQGMKGGQEALV